MNKVIFPIFSLLFLSAIISFGQIKSIEKSELIPGDELDGFVRMMLLPNGSTVLISKGEDFQIHVFDSSRKIRVQEWLVSVLQTEKRQRQSMMFLGAFNNENEVVVFVQALVANAPVIHRLLIDSRTGQVTKEEKILTSTEAPDSAMKAAQSTPQFIIKRDVYSGHYAIAHTDNRIAIQKRIEIIHFSATHKVINRGFLQFKDSSHGVRDLAVIGEEKVIVYADALAKKIGYRYLAALEKGKPTMTVKRIQMGEESGPIFGTLKTVQDRSKLVAAFSHKSSEKMTTTIAIINISDFIVSRSSDILIPKSINDAPKKFFDTKSDIGSHPQMLLTNSDGSYTLVDECGKADANFLYADEVVVLSLNKNFQVMSSHRFPKRQAMDSNKNSFDEKRGEVETEQNNFDSFMRVESSTGHLLFANQRITTAGANQKWTPTAYSHIYADAFVDSFKEGNSEPALLLNKQNQFQSIGGFHRDVYDQTDGMYAFIAVDKADPKMFYVAWVKVH